MSWESLGWIWSVFLFTSTYMYMYYYLWERKGDLMVNMIEWRNILFTDYRKKLNCWMYIILYLVWMDQKTVRSIDYIINDKMKPVIHWKISWAEIDTSDDLISVKWITYFMYMYIYMKLFDLIISFYCHELLRKVI